MSYTKLFSHIVTSSIWTEDDHTRLVWITMLALSNRHGEVMASIPGLARVAGVPIESAERAVAKLSAPDAYSRTPDEEGRRIVKIDGGWALVNYAKHRALASKDDEKQKNAERQRRFRRNHSDRNGKVTDSNAKVTDSNGEVTYDRDIADTDTDTDAFQPQDPSPAFSKPKEKGISDGKPSDLLPTSPTAKRVAAIFHRRPTTAWSAKEKQSYQDIGTIPEDELALMEEFYAAEIPASEDFRRHNLATALNNWPGELDKARRWKAQSKSKEVLYQ